jgi:thiamine-phosphate pyrophosphorylase
MVASAEIGCARLRGLYAIVEDADPVAHAAAVIDGGAEVVQVRLKRAPSGVILEITRRIVELARGRTLVIVNDRADLALLAGASGVHLGDEDLPVAEARALVGPAFLIGRTCRTIEEAEAARSAGADYIGYGPIFESHSKSLSIEPRGIDRLREVCAGIEGPVVAIGGITAETIREIAAAGAAAAAVIEDLFGKGDPRSRAEVLSARFREGRP